MSEAISVLVVGVDTAALSWLAPVPDRTLADLAQLKKAAQELRDAGSPEKVLYEALPIGTCVVEPGGTPPWAFRLRREDETVIHVAGKEKLSEGTPTVKIEIASSYLWAQGYRGAVSCAQRCASMLLGHPDHWLERVSRLDLTADIQGWHPTGADDEIVRFRTHARESFDRRGVPGRVQTISWGMGGPIVVRIYCKSREIVRTRKLWFRKLWALGAEHYDPRAPVWRVEVQIRGEALGEMGLREDWDGNVEPSLDRIWRYVLGSPEWDPDRESDADLDVRALRGRIAYARRKGKAVTPAMLAELEALRERSAIQGADQGGWLTMRAPSADKNTRRHPIDPAWRQLQSITFSDPGARRAVRVAKHESDAENLRAQTAGTLSSLAVLDGVQPEGEDTQANNQAIRDALVNFQRRQKEHDAREARKFATRIVEKLRVIG